MWGGSISPWLQMCISDALDRELSSISNVYYMIGDCISHMVVSVANTVINRQFGRERDTQDCCSHSGTDSSEEKYPRLLLPQWLTVWKMGVIPKIVAYIVICSSEERE